MPLKPLGRSGIQVPPICFGGNVLGWTADEATSFDLLDRLLEAGLNFIDTADVYSRWASGHSGGESEAVIGRWMKARGTRGRVIVATKVGMDMGEGRAGLKPAYIEQGVEASLARLGTDHIDLYYAHTDDADTPQEDTLFALDRLVRDGKVRAIGASNFTAERLASALAISARDGFARYEALQPEYNLSARAPFEGALQQLCLAEGVAAVTYFALAGGFLTGKYRSEADLGKSPRGARTVERHLNARGLRILAALDEVAAEAGAAPASVALAWLSAQPAVTAPIASATSAEQLSALIAATRLTLSPDSLRRLDEASAP